MEMPLTARNVVRVTSTSRLCAKAPNLFEAFGGVKSSKEVRLPRQHKDFHVSKAHILAMRYSVAVKTVFVDYDTMDQHTSCLMAHL